MSKQEKSKQEIRSISMPASLFEQAVERQLAFGYPTFSDYVRALIKTDLEQRRQVFFTLIAEQAQKDEAEREHNLERLQAELQWQKDPIRRNHITSELRRMRGEYPEYEPQGMILNEAPEKRAPAKKARAIKKSSEN